MSNALQERRFRGSDPLDPEVWRRPLGRKVGENLARMFSPLL